MNVFFMPLGMLLLIVLPLVLVIVILGSGKRMRRFLAYTAAIVLVLMVIIVGGVSSMQSNALIEARQIARNSLNSQGQSFDEPGIDARVHSGERLVEVKGSRSGVSVNTDEAPVSKKPSPDAWSAGIEREFKSHLYPSVESAVVATVGLTLSQLEDSLPTDARPELHMSVSDDFYCDASSLAVVLRQKLPVADVRIVDALLTEGDSDAVGLLLSMPLGFLEAESELKTIEATMSLGDKSLARQAQFINKPWIEDLARWQKQYKNKNKSFIVARSSELCPTQEEACEQAREKGAQQLYRLIKPKLQRRRLKLDHGWIRSEIAAMMSGTHAFCQVKPSEQIVVDTFAQRFDRPYGEVYRAALLVDTSPRNVIDLTQYFSKQLSGQRESQRNTLLSAAGLMAVIFVVYLFLNAATKGYYVWSIRIAAIVLAAAGIGFVLFGV